MTQTSMLEVELERLIERKLTGTTLEDRRAVKYHSISISIALSRCAPLSIITKNL